MTGSEGADLSAFTTAAASGERNMRRRLLMKCGLAATIIALGLIDPLLTAFAQSSAFTLTTVVRDGDPISNGAAFKLCGACNASMAGDQSLNDSGQALISGFLSNTCFSDGVYVASDRSGAAVADFCQSTPFGKFSAFFGGAINNQGQVALNIGPIVNNRIIDMILWYSDGQLRKIAADGDQSPTGEIFGDCGFSQPSINNDGQTAFTACLVDNEGRFAGNGVFTYSQGALHKVAVGGDASPLGGRLAMVDATPQPSYINSAGDVLFSAGQVSPDPLSVERFGLFLATADGSVKNVELGGDTMPNGSRAADNSVGLGSLNASQDVAFSLLLSGKPDSGVFLYSAGRTSTVMLAGTPTPIGGTFKSLLDPKAPEDFPRPKLNDNGAVAFQVRVAGGSAPEAIFLASPKAMVKVVAIGDRLPTGERLRGISAFALNNLGQIAFFAHSNGGILHPVGVYLATPVSPGIASAKARGNSDSPKLIVTGEGFITNDSTIQLNGQPVQTEYPTAFHQDGGTTTRLISHDPRLAQLLPAGQVVQVTVVNALTARKSAPLPFTR
jgi:hypothetical protein